MVYCYFLCFDRYIPSRLKHWNKLEIVVGKDVSNIGSVTFCFLLRFGHSQVNTQLWRFEEDGSVSPYGHIPLRDIFFSPERVAREGGIDSMFRGAVRQVAQEVDLKVWSMIRIHNFLLHFCSVWIC